MFSNFLIKKEKSKTVFDNIKNDTSDFEKKRQRIQQLIIYIVCDYKLYMSNLDIKVNSDNKYGIVNLGSGYRVWCDEIIIKYKKMIEDNKLEICNYDINENLLKLNSDNIYFIDYKIDLQKDELYSKNMDFIYHRDMIMVYKSDEWNHIINQIYTSIKNKGYAEFVEYNFVVKHTSDKNTIYNDTINNDSKYKYTNIINDYLTKIFKKNDYEYNINNICIKIKRRFKKVKIIINQLPLYYESKYENICVENIIYGYNHFRKDLNNILKNDEINFEEYINLLKKEWEYNYSYMELYIIIAQK